MSNSVQIVAVVVSVALLGLVLELVRRRVLSEEYSLLWVLFSLALLGLSIWRSMLHAMARWLGIFYPPALLILLLILFVFGASLHFSIIVSRQRRQIERLIEDQAILAAELREARDAGSARAGDERRAMTEAGAESGAATGAATSGAAAAP